MPINKLKTEIEGQKIIIIQLENEIKDLEERNGLIGDNSTILLNSLKECQNGKVALIQQIEVLTENLKEIIEYINKKKNNVRENLIQN